MNALLSNSYLNTTGVVDSINGLVKKSAVSQFEIGKLILKVESEYNSKKENLENRISLAKKDVKSSLKSELAALKEEYNDFIAELPFGKKVAYKFARIAEDKLIKKYIDIAPVAYNSMFEMVGTAEPMWKFMKKNGMTSYTTLGALKQLKKDYIDSTRTPEPEETEEDASDTVSSEENPYADFKVDEPESPKIVTEQYYTAEVMTSTVVTKEQFTALSFELSAVVEKFRSENKLEIGDVTINIYEQDFVTDIAA